MVWYANEVDEAPATHKECPGEQVTLFEGYTLSITSTTKVPFLLNGAESELKWEREMGLSALQLDPRLYVFSLEQHLLLLIYFSMTYEPHNVVITGGCGFIGSNFVNYIHDAWPNCRFVNVDKLILNSDTHNVNEK
ncbi:hypothetical protein GCK32_017979, partial [Trichostrongylus colubriformis]